MYGETLACPIGTAEVSYGQCQAYAADVGLPFERFVRQGLQLWSGCAVFDLVTDSKVAREFVVMHATAPFPGDPLGCSAYAHFCVCVREDHQPPSDRKSVV